MVICGNEGPKEQILKLSPATDLLRAIMRIETRGEKKESVAKF